MLAIYKGFTKVENVWINSCIMLCTIVSSFFPVLLHLLAKKMVPCLSHYMCQLSVLVKPTKVAKNSAQQTTAFVLLLIW